MGRHILGHNWAVQLLQRQVVQEKLRHAYLFTGPPGVGRRTLAVWFAQAIHCTQPAFEGQPCGVCWHCKQTASLTHPDLAVVQSPGPGESLKIEQVRELQSSLYLAPYAARYRVVLFLRFEEATTGAANALLKILEEPPDRVVLVLTAESSEALLPTIVSRCDHIRLRPLSLVEVEKGLINGWKIPAGDARLLAHISGGRPGYAIHLLENPDELQQRTAWLDEHHRLLSARRVERFQFAEKIAKQEKKELAILGQIWAGLWRDVLVYALGSPAPLINLDREAEIVRLAALLPASTARKFLASLAKFQELLEKNINTRLAADVLMLDLPKVQWNP